MTTPVLGFKTGNSSLIISPKNCSSWGGSLAYTETADLNTVLCGVKSSPYFGTDENGNPGGPRNSCTNQLFANVNALYFRNITSPSVIVQKIPTTLIGNVTNANERVDRLSGGDIGSNNSLVGNIFNPSLIGEKYYGINGIRFWYSLGNCVSSPCQPREIHYTLRNIFNPRDMVLQRVRYNRVDLNVKTEVNNIQQNPDEFLTQVQWMYSPASGDAFYGIGNIIDAKGKTIEMKGVTDSNIGSFSKDPLVKIIYEQLCTTWTFTPYTDFGTGYEIPIETPYKVELREKIRISSDILYSDYYEGISSAKKVRYFDVINIDTNEKIGELYAVIDISRDTPKINMWFSYWGGSSEPSRYKIIDTGFDPSTLSSFVSRGNFNPDMELTWGSLPNSNALKTTYGIDLSGKTTDLTKDLDGLKNNYFITVGKWGDNKALYVFTPNCSDLASCIVPSDCFPFGKRICQQGKCLECTQSDKSACTSNQQCYQNVCTNNITCSSDSDCPSDQPIPFCNISLGRCVECNTTADCGIGQICSIINGNICETEPITPVCITNTDCSVEKECINGICVVKNESTSKINIPLILGISIGVLLIIYIVVKLAIKK